MRATAGRKSCPLLEGNHQNDTNNYLTFARPCVSHVPVTSHTHTHTITHMTDAFPFLFVYFIYKGYMVHPGPKPLKTLSCLSESYNLDSGIYFKNKVPTECHSNFKGKRLPLLNGHVKSGQQTLWVFGFTWRGTSGQKML